MRYLFLDRLRWLLILPAAAVLLLTGCASSPLMGGEFAPHDEVTIYHALTKSNATTDQSRVILTDYDDYRRAVKPLQRQSDELLKQWRLLDRRSPQFKTQAQAIADQWAAMDKRQILLTANFESSVASTLDAKQYKAWQSSLRKDTLKRRHFKEHDKL